MMVDVLVPPLEEVFDFELDDRIDEKSLRENIEELISRDKKVIFQVAKREIFNYRMGEFLEEGKSLKEQGVMNGDRLILV